MKDPFARLFIVIGVLYIVLVYVVPNEARPYVSTFIITLFACFAVFVSATKIKNTFHARRTWHKAKGKVRSRTVEEEIVDHEKGYCVYFLSVQVEFQGNGESYICTNIFMGVPAIRFSSYSNANKYRKDIVVGNDIDCFYNPKNPVESAVSLKSNYLRYFLILLGAPTLVFLWWWVLFFIL